ncbi:MAG: DNA polymerase I [Solirubrobacteraceae bacterium]
MTSPVTDRTRARWPVAPGRNHLESSWMPDVFLIDGNSLVYRAFFALPESIATSTGEPTNAIFGFASMLVKLLTDHGIRPTVVAWDAGSSGRREVYADYKAGRSSRPDLLKEQWPAFAPLVSAFGYHNVSVDGYEADDVIATLAEQARTQGVRATIVTGDRDAFQLADEQGLVQIMATARGITETKNYDHQAVLDRYGIPPALIPDFYGLKGDTSDNIPGVPGIGEKTAAELLQRFGTLEGVLAAGDAVSGVKRRENLRLHADNARISRRLATVQRDLELPFELGEVMGGEPDRSQLRDFFRRYELRDPLRRLEEALGEDAARPAPADTRLSARLRVGSVGELSSVGGELALAVVPPPVPDGALFGESETWRFAAAANGEILVGDCARPEELVAAAGTRPVLAHDAKELGLVPDALAHDTMLAAYLLEPARRGYPLAELCEERGLEAAVDDPAGAAALLIQALTERQRPELAERGLDALLRDVELPVAATLRAMEIEGVRLNVDRLAEICRRVQSEIAELERNIHAEAGEEFVIGSPQQLAEVLFVRLGLSRKRRGKTGFSTDARVLAAIRSEHPIVALVERWRELSTLVKTYLEPLPLMVDADSRLHTTFLQAVATTGRLSSTNPNLQNVPIRTPLGREIRGCFEAGPGRLLLAADYSQVELRVLAQLADEPALKEIFHRGEDVHTATACQVFGVAPEELDAGMRSKAKMVNYGIVYGLTDFGLADRLQIGREEERLFIERYLDGFPAVRAFIERTIAQATERGYVTTLLGRRRQITELRARNYQQRTLGERLAVNTVIQGTAADIIKVAMIRCHAALQGLDSRLILQIHDELLFEVPPAEVERVSSIVTEQMTGAWELDPPLAVDLGVGRTWLEAK